MFDEAIILVGGKGIRLSPVVSDRPKPMVLINDVPFLNVLLRFLKKNGVSRIILATGYMHEMISDYYGHSFEGIDLSYSVENQPLGTGGAIALALKKVNESQALVLNGDSFFDVDLAYFYQKFKNSGALAQLALKPIQDVSRYGSVTLGNNGNITSFDEKGSEGKGLINGGIYALDVAKALKLFPAGPFSFEHDFLSTTHEHNKRAEVFDTLFIDIGTPASLEIARALFS